MASARAEEGLEWLSMRLLKDAERAFLAGISKNPKDLDCLVGLARTQRETGADEALQTVERVLAIDSKHQEARSHRAYLRLKGGDVSALEELETLAGAPGAGFWESFNAGVIWAERADSRAASALERARQADPQTSLVYVELGKLRQQEKDYKSAIELFDRAIEVSVPAESQPWRLKARAQRAVGADLEAVATYVELLGRTPKDRELYHETFEFCLQVGAFDTATKVANRARMLDAADPRYIGWHGRALIGAGHAAEARQLLEVAVKQKPDSAEIRGALGLAFVSLGNDVRALPLLHKAIELSPSDPNIATDLAALYLRRNRPDEALRLLQRALASAPDAPVIHLHLATLLSKTDVTQAELHARRALKSTQEQVRKDSEQLLAALGRTP